MRRYYLVFILFCFGFFNSLKAESYYEVRKGNMAFRPKKSSYIFTYGNRVTQGNTGIDFSVSQEFSSSMHSATTAKALAVYQNKNGFYAGVGPGVTHFMNPPPINYPGKLEHLQAVTMEGIVGYDLPHIGRIKPSLQLNVSQPLHVMHSTFKKPMKKSPAVSLGLKFKY